MKGAGLLFLFIAQFSFAQWEIPVRVEMTGTNPEQRQVKGLADPDAPDAAVSHDAARANTMAYAEAIGTMALTTSLVPPATAYTPGMAITIVPSAANNAGATLNVDGLGAIPMVKWGGVPLDSADLVPGVPSRMVYDGSQFHMISSGYRTCPAGFKAVGPNFCISEATLGSTIFYAAATHCSDIGARLCTFSEWVQACRQDTTFISTVMEAEWVDHAANDAAGAKRLGYGSIGSNGIDPPQPSCEHGTSTAPASNGGIRCCRNR